MRPLQTRDRGRFAIRLARFVQRRRKSVTFGVLAVLLAMTALVAPLWPACGLVRSMITAFGTVLLIAGVGVRLMAIAYVGGRKGERLVDGGPYAVTRNPLYCGSLLMMGGAGLLFGSIVLALLYVFSGWLIFSFLIAAEEDSLCSAFGDSYIAYRNRTPRWLPRSWRIAATGTFMVDVRAMRIALREGVAFIAVLPLAEATAWARHVGVLPALALVY